MDAARKIGLSEAIRAVRDELNAAVADAHTPDEQVGFTYREVEINLELALTKEGEGKAGAKFWVVSTDVKAGLKAASTHKVRIVLDPYHLQTGAALRISGGGTGLPD